MFLLLSVAGKIGALIVTEPKKQKIAALIGVVLLFAGLGLHLTPVFYKEVTPDVPVTHEERTTLEERTRQDERVTPGKQILLTPEFLTSRSFEFLHAQGDVISPQVELAPSGEIRGIDHPNETRWGLEGSTLVFYHESGEPSTRFTEMQREDGKVVLSGRLLLTPPQEVVIHVLKER